MTSEATKPSTLTIRQSRSVLLWKSVEYAGLLTFIVAVPRLMGPDLYGRLALLLSILGVAAVAFGLGAGQVFARFIPEYEHRHERYKTQALFMQLLIVRVTLAVLIAGAFILAFPRLLPGLSPSTTWFGAGAILLSAVAITCFQVFLGLNDLGRWLVYQALSKPVFMIILLALGVAGRFQSSALALLLAQVVLVALGIFWARSFFAVRHLASAASSVFPHIRFGLAFFAANLLLIVIWRGGETFVLLFSNRPEEVAFFNVASSINLAVYALIGELAMMTIPSLTALHVSGEQQQMNVWLGFTLKYLTIASFAFVIVAYLLAEWVLARVLGVEYLAVADNLQVLALALIPLALIRTGFSMATVQKEPRRVLWVTAPSLLTFVVVSAILVPGSGSYGASIAVVIALLTAGIITYLKFPLGPVLAAANYWRLLALGLGSVGVLMLPAIPSVLAALVAVLFGLLLFVGKVVSVGEIRLLIGAGERKDTHGFLLDN